MTAVSPYGLPPDEALQWFREKGYALTFDHRDMYGAEHARAFSVAKATQLDLLSDIRAELDRAIANGSSLASFQKRLTPLLQERGWWGQQRVQELDKDGSPTGRTVTAQLGSARRLRTIYETNLRQAMAAGRWERIERTAKLRPYLRYVAIHDGRTRDEHLKWNGTVLRWDHPWWKTHAPPNGWGCRCRLQQLSESDLRRFGFKVSEAAPQVAHQLVTNERTGQIMRVPIGIDPSFDYNPGAAPRGGQFEGNPLKAQPNWERVTWRGVALESASDWRARPAPPGWPRVRTNADATAIRQLFRATFGIERGSTKTLSDPTGLQVHVSEERLLDHLLDKKETKAGIIKFDEGRASLATRLREAIEDPEEIWMVPYRYPNGRVVMRQRYLVRFADPSQGSHIVIVHRDPDGWLTWTTYARGDAEAGFNRQREGYLVYKRGGG